MDLVDEMLLEGPGRIRALFVAGGNPVAAWPDQERTIQGLRALDLLVVVDPMRTSTARLADYVIPPKLLLEVVSATTMQDYFGTMNYATGYVESFAQYVEAAVAPPTGSELIEEWEFFYEVARRLGRSLRIAGTEIPASRRPTTRELLEIMTRGARIPLAEVERHPHGAFFMDETIRVEAASADAAERLELASPPMMEQLSKLASSSSANVPDERFPFRMIVRRMRHVQNSMLHGVVAGRASDNPAYLSRDDATRLGVEAGDRLAIYSATGEIEARVAIDEALRPGLVSISHGFGGLPGDGEESPLPGSNTGLLIDVDHDYDLFTGQPRMSDVPVGLRRITLG
jgi:anaerobic selenocysteine-containing dehydrogenase